MTLEMVIDYSESRDEWIAVCPEHGVIARESGDQAGHNRTVGAAGRHEEFEHDGDGMIYWQTWLY